jgi:tetratricopeptide (TPR) repeat protein
LYQLARAYETAGKTDDALWMLDELVTRHPETPRIVEVQFRRGEMLFMRKDYNAAESAYAAVVEFGDGSRFYEQSLYKLGWARFKLGWHQDSLMPFFDLLDRKIAAQMLADPDGYLGGLSRADRELVEDTLRVLSISFSYMDGAASIAALLDTRGNPAYSYVIYRNLGDLYLEQERFQDAAETYEAFIALDPGHPKSPLLQVEVIEAYKRGRFPTLVIGGKKDFAARYGMDKPFWQRNPLEDNPAVEASLKENLTDLARYYHAEAQSSKSQVDYQQAAHWYRKRLAYFPDEPDSAHTSFLLAEVLFESREFREAMDAYEHAAYDFPLHEESAEAAYAAVLAYREHEKELTGDAKADWHQHYLESGLNFASAYPEHPHAAAVLTTIAEDLFSQSQFDRAIAVGQSVVRMAPPVEPALARTSWTVIAHSYFDIGNFAEAEQAYYSLQALTPEDDTGVPQDVRDRIASSIYKQGEQARDAGDFETAVAHFKRLGQAVPDSSIRATAEYDAAAALIAMEAWDRAAIELAEFRRNYPDSQYAGAATRNLAAIYLEAGKGAQAADELVNIANAAESDDDVKREALWKAADLYKESGAIPQEKSVLEDIIVRYPDPISESVEARFRLLEISENNADSDHRTRILQDLIDVDAAAGDDRSDRTRYLAAKASLELAESVRRRFAAMEITQPIAESMELKKSLMQDALNVYATAAAFGVAEVTTAATFRLGEVYQQFSKDLMESERPDGLDQLALEQYELLLEEQTYPFEEKAIELFEANVSRVPDGVWDEWVRRSFAALATLMPARYAKTEKSEDVVTALY